jgi:hypothetical protein
METDKDMDVLNMSLDDIINKNKNKVGGEGKAKEREGGRKGRAENGKRPVRAGGSSEGKRSLGRPTLDKLRVVIKNTGVSKSFGGRGGRGQVGSG